MHPHHKEILEQIKFHSGSPTKHTFLESYLGNNHPRYDISNPVLRTICRGWMKEHKAVTAREFSAVLTDLINGKSFTEKITAGILLDYATKEQRKINIRLFDTWLDQLEGWAEIDTLCTGKFTRNEVPANFAKWQPLLRKLARSKHIGKRRASLVLLCSPVSHSDNKALADLALENIETLKHEKMILITKAISWLLRSMIKHHRSVVVQYLAANSSTLPAIAVRETQGKLTTGKKS